MKCKDKFIQAISKIADYLSTLTLLDFNQDHKHRSRIMFTFASLIIVSFTIMTVFAGTPKHTSDPGSISVTLEPNTYNTIGILNTTSRSARVAVFSMDDVPLLAERFAERNC